MQSFKTSHLIKTEDLNHHDTLFAGRMAAWFVEACFIAAARTCGNPDAMVCLKIHGFKFSNPGHRGEIIEFETRVVLAGTTSLTIYGKAVGMDGRILADGFITFVHVDETGVKTPHGIVLPGPLDESEWELVRTAKGLK